MEYVYKLNLFSIANISYTLIKEENVFLWLRGGKMRSDYFAGSFMCIQSILVISLFSQSLNDLSPKSFFTVFFAVLCKEYPVIDTDFYGGHAQDAATMF